MDPYVKLLYALLLSESSEKKSDFVLFNEEIFVALQNIIADNIDGINEDTINSVIIYMIVQKIKEENLNEAG